MRSKQTEKILLNSLRVYEHFLAAHYSDGRVMLGKNISNPFLPHPQKTPSFNIFKGTGGEYLFNDFATGDKGSVITFVMKIERTNYQNALKIINKILR